MADPNQIPISIIPSVRPTPQIVPQLIVQRWAKETGNPDPHKDAMGAITVPSIRVDQTSLHFEQRRGQTEVEFRFQKGMLYLYIANAIYVSNKLSECERRIVLQHEFGHVVDNERIAGPLMERLQADPFMQSLFVQRQWLSRNSFKLILSSIQETCFRIFRELTDEARRRRDTAAEYRRLRALIHEKCRPQATRQRISGGAQSRR
jgi:hypothetical protein